MPWTASKGTSPTACASMGCHPVLVKSAPFDAGTADPHPAARSPFSKWNEAAARGQCLSPTARAPAVQVAPKHRARTRPKSEEMEAQRQ